MRALTSNFKAFSRKTARISSPANRIFSCKKWAVVVGRLRLGWKEMIVLSLIFRMRWTDNRSKTRNRLSLEGARHYCGYKLQIEKNLLEYSARGECGSIICLPRSVLGAATLVRLSVDLFIIDRKKLRVIVMSTGNAEVSSENVKVFLRITIKLTISNTRLHIFLGAWRNPT